MIELKILLVNESFSISRGAELGTQDLANELGKTFDVAVLTPSYGPNFGIVEEGNFTIFRYRNHFVPSGSIIQQKFLFFNEMTKHLSDFAKRFKPNVIHAQNALSVPAVAHVATLHHTVGIAHLRDHRFECFTSRLGCQSHRDATLFDFARCMDNRFYSLIFPYAKLVTRTIRRSLTMCGKVIPVSNYLNEEFVRSGVVAEAKVVYDGVNLESIAGVKASTEEYGQNLNHDSTIFYAGGCAKSKGVFVLLKSFLALAELYKESSLVLAGGGFQTREVLRFIATHGLTKRVRVTGRIPHEELISLMKSSTLIVVPSLLPEACPRVAIEAMACGKPIVGSSRGAVPEILGKAGVVVEPTCEKMTQSIAALLEDASLRKRLSQLAWDRSQEFSIGRTAKQVIKAYDDWVSDTRLTNPR
jgi:glycosyltransferase involved in cell wall biosynthesis